METQNFIHWKRKRLQARDSTREARIAFRNRHNTVLVTALIGSSVFNDIGVKADDYIDIFYDKDNKKILYLKKSDNEIDSYRVQMVMSSKNKVSGFLKLVFTCWLTAQELTEEDSQSHVIPYKIDGGVLMLNAS
jgi:hypothetical protein